MSWGHVQPSLPSATVVCSPIPYQPGLCAAQSPVIQGCVQPCTPSVLGPSRTFISSSAGWPFLFPPT